MFKQSDCRSGAESENTNEAASTEGSLGYTALAEAIALREPMSQGVVRKSGVKTRQIRLLGNLTACLVHFIICTSLRESHNVFIADTMYTFLRESNRIYSRNCSAVQIDDNSQDSSSETFFFFSSNAPSLQQRFCQRGVTLF